MLHRVLFWSLFLMIAGATVSAAEKSDSKKLAESLQKWQEAKKACGGNYTYKVSFSSFTGYREETVIVVKDNKVVERRQSTATPKAPGQPAELKLKWTETEKDLGKNKGLQEPLTLNQLYEQAKKIVEQAVPDNHVRSLGFDKQGILQYCFLRDKRIADDAPRSGVRPIELTLEKK